METGLTFEYLNITTTSVLVILGDLMKKNKALITTPEMEFFVDLRNSVAHGNKFKFLYGRPLPGTIFKTLEITAALEGKRVLEEKGFTDHFIGHGDILELLDVIEAQLRA